MAATGKDSTGTRDTVYDLVSIIYHALQGAETYGMYVGDAEEVGDADQQVLGQPSQLALLRPQHADVVGEPVDMAQPHAALDAPQQHALAIRAEVELAACVQESQQRRQAVRNGGKGMGFPLKQTTDALGEVDLEKLVIDSALGLDEEAQKANLGQIAIAFNELLPIIPMYERFGNNAAIEGVRVKAWPADDDPIHVPHARLHAAIAGEPGDAELLLPVYVRAPDAKVRSSA